MKRREDLASKGEKARKTGRVRPVTNISGRLRKFAVLGAFKRRAFSQAVFIALGTTLSRLHFVSVPSEPFVERSDSLRSARSLVLTDLWESIWNGETRPWALLYVLCLYTLAPDWISRLEPSPESPIPCQEWCQWHFPLFFLSNRASSLILSVFFLTTGQTVTLMYHPPTKCCWSYIRNRHTHWRMVCLSALLPSKIPDGD